MQRQLEVRELTRSDVFGEDMKNMAKRLVSYENVIGLPLPYSTVAAAPLDVYVIKKRYLYYYLDDEAKQQFQNYLKDVPDDDKLRRYFLEKQNFEEYVRQTRPIRDITDNGATN